MAEVVVKPKRLLVSACYCVACWTLFVLAFGVSGPEVRRVTSILWLVLFLPCSVPASLGTYCLLPAHEIASVSLMGAVPLGNIALALLALRWRRSRAQRVPSLGSREAGNQ